MNEFSLKFHNLDKEIELVVILIHNEAGNESPRLATPKTKNTHNVYHD